MEINYDMIIKYLSPNKNESYRFDSQRNMMGFSDKFPSEFRDLLGDKFYRIGVTQEIENQKISFFTSFLTLLVDNYMTLMENEEKTHINKLMNELNEYTNKNVPKSLEDIIKGVLKKYIKDKEICIWTLELLVHKFGINLLILDFKTINIYTVYPSDVMNPWKPFLLFGKYENNWEPIRNNEKSMFSYNDNIIKKILLGNQLEVKYYDSNIIKKDYFLLDNIHEILHTEFKKEESSVITEDNNSEVNDENTDDSLVNENNKTFIKNSIDIKISKTKLEKMKKNEIIDYMKSLNMNVTVTTKTTKKQLLEMIE
jgi:hypothetical protein